MRQFLRENSGNQVACDRCGTPVVRITNRGQVPKPISPIVVVDSELIIDPQSDGQRLRIGKETTLLSLSGKFNRKESTPTGKRLHFPKTVIPAGGEELFALSISRGAGELASEVTTRDALEMREQAEQFWNGIDLPYDRLQIPDRGVQALVDSSIRNIYQAREIKKGLPAFQVGPTCYRGLWVVDGSFLLEAISYLGRTNETRAGVEYLLGFQREDGAFMLIDGHWKETGIALWAVTRHARLTDDKAWLREVWPKVERGVAFIRKMRSMPSADSPNASLIPDGFSDGGLAGKVPEYTNIYWTLAGLHAAIDAAHWLGLENQAQAWQLEYNNFFETFRNAARRDMKLDSAGNRYLPIRMRSDETISPQKAQWAFLHAVFPGKVFSAMDPLVQGNMAMLAAVERQGLVLDTGWLGAGIWTYFGSFYGHALLWLGQGEKAGQTLYAFGNHASPLLVWREEQKPVGTGPQVVGDMPHNWASAEFIRLVRHSLILERGDELHLFEGMPAAWAKPGCVTKATNILTEFGFVSVEVRVAADGSTAKIKLSPPVRSQPKHIFVHLDSWSGQHGKVEVTGNRPSETEVSLR